VLDAPANQDDLGQSSGKGFQGIRKSTLPKAVEEEVGEA
tara:strand:- start:312 stop:428 length:117 start_codon:yes stop_codon:yes gene_type:complete